LFGQAIDGLARIATPQCGNRRKPLIQSPTRTVHESQGKYLLMGLRRILPYPGGKGLNQVMSFACTRWSLKSLERHLATSKALLSNSP
jgi:hypothetical protein